MSVSFLNRSQKQGAKSVVGPVTGLSYNIVPSGTPISSLDADALLSMTEPPCCGESVPFDGEVRSFGVHTPSFEQLQGVPEELWNAKAIAKPKRTTGRKKKLHVEYEKPGEETPNLVVEDKPKEKSEED